MIFSVHKLNFGLKRLLLFTIQELLGWVVSADSSNAKKVGRREIIHHTGVKPGIFD